MNIFYVYCYLDPRKPGQFSYGDFEFKYEPFYIGKGKGDRLNDHLRTDFKNTTNPIKTNKILKIINDTGSIPIIFKIYENLEESIANELEIKLINIIGKSIDKNGPLSNIMDGGLGGYNINAVNSNRLKRKGKTWEEIYGKELSDELKAKASITQKNRIHKKGMTPWNKGKTGYKVKGRSDESKKRTSLALKSSIKHKEALSSKEVRDKIASKCRELTLDYWKNPEYVDKILASRKKYFDANPKIKKDELIHQISLTLNKSKIKTYFNVSYPTLDKYIKKYQLEYLFK